MKNLFAHPREGTLQYEVSKDNAFPSVRYLRLVG